MPNPKFFRNFPIKNWYIGEQEKAIIDIGRYIKISPDILSKKYPFYDYQINDGERPDHVAYSQYGNSKFYWIVLVVNNIRDIWKEWPLSTKEFKSYIINKYGSVQTAKTQTYAFYNADGLTVNESVYLTLPADERSKKSYYEYEDELNENRRNIKLIQPQFLSKIQSDLESLFE